MLAETREGNEHQSSVIEKQRGSMTEIQGSIEQRRMRLEFISIGRMANYFVNAR
jgi:hypothetical protein